MLNILVRLCPGSTTLRPMLHRARGVKIGRDVFIGDDVFIDGEYPEMIEIQDGAAVSIRAVIIAHNKGPGKVIIEKEAFVGPNVVVACNGGRVVRIGEGAVIGAGCVVTRSIPPHAVLAPAPAHVTGHATVPLVRAETLQEFLSGLKPLNPSPPKPHAKPGGTVPTDATS